jgi:hypothetical protein
MWRLGVPLFVLETQVFAAIVYGVVYGCGGYTKRNGYALSRVFVVRVKLENSFQVLTRERWFTPRPRLLLPQRQQVCATLV